MLTTPRSVSEDLPTPPLDSRSRHPLQGAPLALAPPTAHEVVVATDGPERDHTLLGVLGSVRRLLQRHLPELEAARLR